jgi:hypothetical protein
VRGVCRWPSGQRRTHHSERLPPGERNGFACPHPIAVRPVQTVVLARTAAERINDERQCAAPAIEPDAVGVRRRSRRRVLRRGKGSGFEKPSTVWGKRFFAGRAPPGRPSLWRPSARPPPYGGRRQLGFAAPHRLAVQPKRSHVPFCEVNLLEVEDSVAGRVEGLDSPAPAGSSSTTGPRSSVPGMSSASRPRLSVGGGRTIPPETNHHNPAPMRPQSSPRCRTHEWPPAPEQRLYLGPAFVTPSASCSSCRES